GSPRGLTRQSCRVPERCSQRCPQVSPADALDLADCWDGDGHHRTIPGARRPMPRARLAIERELSEKRASYERLAQRYQGLLVERAQGEAASSWNEMTRLAREMRDLQRVIDQLEEELARA